MDSVQAVTLGDSTTRLSIPGRESIERWVKTAPHQFKLITLTSVLHIRDIQQHFLSPSRLNNKGWTIPLTPETKFSIQDRDTCFYGRHIGTLYHVYMYAKPPPSSTTLNAVQALPIKVWHK